MSAVSETIVREYFELHGFFVRQQRKYISPTRQEEDEIDFYVLNPAPDPKAHARPFLLGSSDLAGIARAVVVVKGWHTDTFTPSLLVNAPEVYRFIESPAFLPSVTRAFGTGTHLVKILVVPGLPSQDEARQQSITFLRERGLDAVLSFHTMLAELIQQIEVNRNYQKSDLLQIIRILKNYDFLKDPQLELFAQSRRPRPRKPRAAAPPEPPT